MENGRCALCLTRERFPSRTWCYACTKVQKENATPTPIIFNFPPGFQLCKTGCHTSLHRGLVQGRSSAPIGRKLGDPHRTTYSDLGPNLKIGCQPPPEDGQDTGVKRIAAVWMRGWHDRTSLQHCVWPRPSPKFEQPGIVQPQNFH